MGAYAGATYFFGKPLWNIAKELNYTDDLICILRDDADVVKTRFSQTYSNILSCSHKMDSRKPIEYAKDLVASWVIEDYLCKYLSFYDLSIQLNGSDRERKILPNSKVCSSSDYIVCYNHQKRKVELMNDYGSFWKNYEILHLRDSKYKELLSENSLLLAVSFSDQQFRIFDFSKNIDVHYVPSHKNYGGKPAYSIKILNKDMKKFAFYVLAEEIKKYF